MPIAAQTDSPKRSKIARELPPTDVTMAMIGLVVSSGIKMKPRGYLWYGDRDVGIVAGALRRRESQFFRLN